MHARFLRDRSSGDGLCEKTDFQLFTSLQLRRVTRSDVGIPLHCRDKCVPSYTTGSLPPANLEYYENDQRDHKDHYEKAGIKTRAENVAYQLATGQREQH